MNSAKQHRTDIDPTGSTAQSYPRLDQINRPTLTTQEAAHFLMRRPQTLRIWASRECGPLRPIRVNGRLAWSVEDVRRVLGVHL